MNTYILGTADPTTEIKLTQQCPAYATLMHPAITRLVPSLSNFRSRSPPRSSPSLPPTEIDLTYDATIETTLRFAQARLCTPRASIADLSSLSSHSSRNSSTVNLHEPTTDTRSKKDRHWSENTCTIRIVHPKNQLKQRKDRSTQRYLSREEIAEDSIRRRHCMRKFV